MCEENPYQPSADNLNYKPILIISVSLYFTNIHPVAIYPFLSNLFGLFLVKYFDLLQNSICLGTLYWPFNQLIIVRRVVPVLLGSILFQSCVWLTYNCLTDLSRVNPKYCRTPLAKQSVVFYIWRKQKLGQPSNKTEFLGGIGANIVIKAICAIMIPIPNSALFLPQFAHKICQMKAISKTETGASKTFYHRGSPTIKPAKHAQSECLVTVQ